MYAGAEEQEVTESPPESDYEPEASIQESEAEEPAVEASDTTAETPARRNPTRNRQPPVRFDEEFAGMAIDKPITYSEAMSSGEKAKWEVAVQEEMDAIMKSGALVRADLPPGRRAISTKFIFKRKLDIDGLVKRYKARLVAHGNLQRHGVDYEETYAPVVDWEVALAAISIMLRRKAVIELVDFITAFLGGDVEEEIYVTLPRAHNKEQFVYRLEKSLYGLKQSPRCWFKKLSTALLKFGFRELSAADCVFVKGKGSNLVALLVYVDDMVIMSESQAAVNQTKRDLKADFKITDLGPLSFFLGIKFERSIDGRSMNVSQEKYTERVLERFGMQDSRPVATPMAANFLSLSASGPKDYKEREEVSRHPYRAVLGCLLYIARHSRPDITFAVSVLCRSVQDPSMHHWVAVKRLMRYLRGTKFFGITIGAVDDKSKHPLEAYVDADWAGEHGSRKSTTGFLIKVFGSCVSWRSLKQKVTALSTAEAEYVAMSECVRVVSRTQNLLVQLGEKFKTAQVWEDNQPCIAWAEKGGMRTKHIDVRYHFVKDKLQDESVKIGYCPTDKQQADVLTKPVPAEKTQWFIEVLGMYTR